MAITPFPNEPMMQGVSLFALAARAHAGRPFLPPARPVSGWAEMAEERAFLRCRLARSIASAVMAVPVEEIARPNRSVAEICQARHVAIYLAHVVFQVSLGAIAASFGRDRTSVAHAIRRVEDGRDEAGFEELISRMERLAETCIELAGERAFA